MSATVATAYHDMLALQCVLAAEYRLQSSDWFMYDTSRMPCICLSTDVMSFNIVMHGRRFTAAPPA